MKRLLSLLAGLFAVTATAADPAPGKVKVKISETTFDFTIGDELVARYHKGPDVAKPYFWPLNAPGGVPVTRSWPMQKGMPRESTDHPHQKSAWFCHGDVIPEGLELKVRSADKNVKGVDFWSEGKGHGTIACVAATGGSDTGGVARIPTDNEWRTADGTKILDEHRTITVRNLGDARLIVLDIDLYASVCPITFGDTKEGSMGVRVNDEIKVKGGNGTGTFVNSAGEANEKAVWGRRSDWNDYFGKVGGQAVGIAVFDHPKNKNRACWHSREYGLMAANPFGRAASGFPDVKGQTELVKLAKDEHLRLKYGILLHRGDAKEGRVAEHFATFAKD